MNVTYTVLELGEEYAGTGDNWKGISSLEIRNVQPPWSQLQQLNDKTDKNNSPNCDVYSRVHAAIPAAPAAPYS